MRCSHRSILYAQSSDQSTLGDGLAADLALILCPAILQKITSAAEKERLRKEQEVAKKLEAKAKLDAKGKAATVTPASQTKAALEQQRRQTELLQKKERAQEEQRRQQEQRCGTSQRGLPSNTMALITSDCGSIRSLGSKWP